MLIRGGHVLDARNDIDGVMDVAIDDGVIAEVAASIDPARAETVVDAGDDWHPVDRAVAAGEAAGIPVAVDFGGHAPPLSLEDLFMTHLRPGDIFTHTYANVRGRISIVDDEGHLRPFVRRARERGIVFDVGHGGGSFLFRQAIPAMDQGFPPDTISTDLHTGSMNGGMKDMLNVMSKFLVMGMSLEDNAGALALATLGACTIGQNTTRCAIAATTGSATTVRTRKMATRSTRRSGIGDFNNRMPTSDM